MIQVLTVDGRVGEIIYSTINLENLWLFIQIASVLLPRIVQVIVIAVKLCKATGIAGVDGSSGVLVLIGTASLL